MTIIKVTEILDYSKKMPESSTRFDLTLPVSGDTYDIRRIKIRGEFTHNNPNPPQVEFFCNGLLAKVTATSSQAHLSQKITGLHRYTFDVTISTLGLPHEFSIQVSAQFENKPVIKLCQISATQTAFQSTYKSDINPIMVTSLGRSGSTLMMKLLMGHPGILAAKVYPYEIRIASYWLRVLRTLGMPKVPGAQVASDLFAFATGVVGPNPFLEEGLIKTESARNWVNHNYLEKLAVFCQAGIEDHYKLIANEQNRELPQYFAEKVPPSKNQYLLWDLYPQAREIILVRDFRDMVSSVFAFNEKRGYSAFGKKDNQSEVDYVKSIRPMISQMQSNWLERKDKAYLVRYEDIVAQPETTIKGIMDYLGLECSSADISQILEDANKDSNEIAVHTTSNSVENSIGRWKQDLGPDVKRMCQEVFGDISEFFGYSDKE